MKIVILLNFREQLNQNIMLTWIPLIWELALQNKMKLILWNKTSYLGLKFDGLSLCQEAIQCHLQLCEISFIQRLFTDTTV